MNKTTYRNPFPSSDSDRHTLWEMLVKRDTQAFIKQDWGKVAEDFIEGGFIGISGHQSGNPDSWMIAFPNLEAYRDEWLRQAKDFGETQWACNAEQLLYDLTDMRDIEIQRDSALLHKKFDGAITKKDGGCLRLSFQTLYRCCKVNGQWKIAGFTFDLPLLMGQVSASELTPSVAY